MPETFSVIICFVKNLIVLATDPAIATLKKEPPSSSESKGRHACW